MLMQNAPAPAKSKECTLVHEPEDPTVCPHTAPNPGLENGFTGHPSSKHVRPDVDGATKGGGGGGLTASLGAPVGASVGALEGAAV